MRPSNPSDDAVRGDDSGSASLEFILAGVVMLVPLIYLVVTLGMLQAHALGVESAARHVARSIATAADAAEGDARADRIVTAVAEEYGIDPSTIEIDVSCTTSGACPAPGEVIVVTVSASAALPLVPPFLGIDQAARVSVEAVAVQKVSRTWTG